MSNKITSHDTPTPASKDVDLGEVYTRTETFLENNKKALTIGAIAVVGVVALLVAYKYLIAKPNADAAKEAIWKAEYYFEIDSLDKAINGDAEFLGFAAIADEYGSTPSGNLANYYLGAIHMQKGDYEAALEYYGKADLDDDILGTMAVGNQGDALVELGRTEEAVKQFEKAANMSTNDLTTPMYLMKAGILHQQAGAWDRAAKAFERIVKEFPSSNEASQARKYAGRSEAMGG